MTSENLTELVAVGKIVGCFGLKGDIKVQPMTHSIERFKVIDQIYLGTSPKKVTSMVIERVSLKGYTVLLKLQDVNNRTAAEKFLGYFIFIDEEKIKRPNKGSYFVHEIIGCNVWSDTGEHIGVIKNVLKFPAHDVWEIQNGDKLYMIPVVKEFIKSVNIETSKVIVRLINGLIEE